MEFWRLWCRRTLGGKFHLAEKGSQDPDTLPRGKSTVSPAAPPSFAAETITMDAKEENARATEAVDALNAPQNASAIAVPQSHEFVHSASFASSTDSETVEIIDDDGLEHPHVAHVAKTGKDGEDTMEAHPAFSPPPDGGLRAWSTIVASFFMHFIAIVCILRSCCHR